MNLELLNITLVSSHIKLIIKNQEMLHKRNKDFITKVVSICRSIGSKIVKRQLDITEAIL